jgi:uncharacterized protein YjbI with pentapeptide repeats
LLGVSLTKSDLRGADLRGANLRRINVHGAKLSNTYLPWVNLSGADLRLFDRIYACIKKKIGGKNG